MKTLLAILLLTTGCSGTLWKADSRFTTTERADISHAISEWEGVGQHFDVVYGRVTGLEDSGKYIVRATSRDAGFFSYRFWEDPQVSGKYLHPMVGHEMLVLVPERHGMTPFWQVTAHEMGHALGMEHVEDPKALMFSHSATESLGCITQADVVEMCRTAGCPGGMPKGCDVK